MSKWILEFEYPVEKNKKIVWKKTRQKLKGTKKEMIIHVGLLKKYGSMRNIKLGEVV